MEWNPILAYYLDRGDLLFFAVKYLLTCAAILIILSITRTHVFGHKLRVKALLVFFIVALASGQVAVDPAPAHCRMKQKIRISKPEIRNKAQMLQCPKQESSRGRG